MTGFFAAAAVGVVIYLGLVGGGLTAAFLATVVLKGVKLI
ncbi:cytochrome B6 [Synechococcus sp. CCY 9618]|nr:cytochrome B6 [Synechococcus sp. CCY 9618]